jgi:hypothetical protein
MHYKTQPPVLRLKNVQRVLRARVDGTKRTHYYHRPTRIRLPSPDQPEFRRAYEEAERLHAERKGQWPMRMSASLDVAWIVKYDIKT